LLRSRSDEIRDRFPIVARRRNARAGALSGGEQRIVEIARTFMLDPMLLLMDEPSTGLDPKARHQVFETIREINATGRTVLLVEQNARSGLAIAHHGAVMESGVVRLRGTGASLLEDPEVARLYLGTAGAGVA
jgi:branched-chain amino acid transport system ATP-binding protein